MLPHGIDADDTGRAKGVDHIFWPMLAFSCHPPDPANSVEGAGRGRAGAERLRACAACSVFRCSSQSRVRCFRAVTSSIRFCSSHISVELRYPDFPELPEGLRGLEERPDDCFFLLASKDSTPSAKLSNWTAFNIPAITLPGSSLSFAPPDSRSTGNLAAGNGTRMGGLDVPAAASAIASVSPQSIA
jgi:hypothetical protein